MAAVEPVMVAQQTPFDRGGALALQVALSALAGFVTTLLWALTGGGYFWPGWVWFALATAVGAHIVLARALSPTPRTYRALRIHAEATALVVAIYTAIWLLGGGGDYWPLWPLSVFLPALGVHAIVVWQRPRPREQELEERVDVLTRTRRGAVDVQAAELRRIERDLHDGAQARLVGLAMLLGHARRSADADPAAVPDLLDRSLAELRTTLSELRDLARGIHPAILTEKGLDAALYALASRAPVPVTLDSDGEGRLPEPVEVAAYFVVSEAITNVAKYARATEANVAVHRVNGCLTVDVSDDGVGGADPARGSGLRGAADRIAALDGTLTVESPPGRGTRLHVEIPCDG